MLVLHPPVEAPIVREFRYAGSPFAAGLHRGIDYGSAAGATVRAPCGGRVAWAGTDGVTLVCAGRRVTLLPLKPAVVEGAPVVTGALVGSAGADPLHLGVRRPGDPFGYENPRRFMTGPPLSVPVVGPRTPPSGSPVTWDRGPAPRGAPAPAPVKAPLAPWPAWAGLAAALAGALGAGGARWRRARRAVRTRVAPARAGVGGDTWS